VARLVVPMAEFPAPAEGVLLTYLVVSSDVDRSRRFYAEVLIEVGQVVATAG